jgi:hypothetical protein
MEQVMAFNKKGAPSARTLNDPVGFAQSTQKAAGNSVDLNEDCYSSGIPTVSGGGVVSNDGTPMDWPFSPAIIADELDPQPIPAKQRVLNDNPSTSGGPIRAGGHAASNVTNPGALG